MENLECSMCLGTSLVSDNADNLILPCIFRVLPALRLQSRVGHVGKISVRTSLCATVLILDNTIWDVYGQTRIVISKEN